MNNCPYCSQILPDGFVKKSGRPRLNDYEKIISLRREGKKLREIAEQTNCSLRTVTRTLATQCR